VKRNILPEIAEKFKKENLKPLMAWSWARKARCRGAFFKG